MTLFWWKIAVMNDDDRYIRITLRIPKDLHRQLGEEADATSKSLNAEIVGRLAASFQSSAEPSPPAEVALPELIEQIERLQAKMDKASILERKNMLVFEMSWLRTRESDLTSYIAQATRRIEDLEAALAEAEDAEHMAKAKRIAAKLDLEKLDLASLQEGIESLRQEQQERSAELKELLARERQ